MGEIADMMLEGLLDEETGEYIGDANATTFGTEAPGFPVSYRHGRPHIHGRPMDTPPGKVACPECDRNVRAVGLGDHMRDKHDAVRGDRITCPLCDRSVKVEGMMQHVRTVHGDGGEP